MSAPASDTGTYSELELDIDSDSEWQDIGSSRGAGTDVDDSASELSDGDSARLDRWEGVIESGHADSPFITPNTYPGHAPVEDYAANVLTSGQTSPLGRLVSSPLARNVLATEEDLMEDERVQSALDQSMVSTLNASRSSGSSSRAELRLSFPDPLTSSREIVPLEDMENVAVSADELALTQSPVTSEFSVTDISQAQGNSTVLETRGPKESGLDNTSSSTNELISTYSPVISDSSVTDDPTTQSIFTALETLGSNEVAFLADSRVTRESSEPPRSASPDHANNRQVTSIKPGQKPMNINARRLLDQVRGYHVSTVYVRLVPRMSVF
jgi:hypothetical protein